MLPRLFPPVDDGGRRGRRIGVGRWQRETKQCRLSRRVSAAAWVRVRVRVRARARAEARARARARAER